jgi:23S rRNA pseudouridine2605 synthase
MSSERLQKVLSKIGLGSRREMERWIEAGFIHVNDKVAKIGDSVTADDRLKVKGKHIDNPLKITQNTRILLYNKPVGEISSRHDPHHKRTVFDQLPTLKTGRWIQVGRLDINTSGLLIFTNDGMLANRLMHPKFEIEREYAARVYGEVTREQIQALLKGVQLEDGIAKFKKIEYRGGEGTNSWYHVILSEGRNREVRRLWQSQEVVVSRLIRVRYGSLSMPRYLGRGESVELTPAAVESFIASL